MLNQRTAGILCPIFSLPSEEGIGTLGIKAHEFVDFLKASKQKYWQILPIGLTSYGDSPYQSFSSYAGNPYFIDLSILKQKNYLKDLDFDWGNPEYIEYESLWNNKYTILKTAFKASNFGNKELQKAFQKYTWLEDFATFMALKNHFKNSSRLDWTEARTKKTLSDSLKSKIRVPRNKT
jgi:4-alpha-glucanotransferase